MLHSSIGGDLAERLASGTHFLIMISLNYSEALSWEGQDTGSLRISQGQCIAWKNLFGITLEDNGSRSFVLMAQE